MTVLSGNSRLRWHRSIVRILVLAAVVSGCREDRAIAPSTPNSSPTEPLHSVSDSRRPPTYLPYGVPVPDTEVLVAEPEPYDRNRHGPTLKDTRPGDNLAARPGVELPRVKLGPGVRGMTGPSFASAEVSPSTSGYNDSWRGYNVEGGRGIYARFDLPDPPQVTAPNPPSDWIAYTPTALPYGWSCLEVTGLHVKDHNQWGGIPYNDAFAIWDWCNQIKFVYSANATNYSFRDPYTRFYTDQQGQPRRAYWAQVFEHTPTKPLHTSDCWEADIYNFDQGRWEEKWTSCGISQLPTGRLWAG